MDKTNWTEGEKRVHELIQALLDGKECISTDGDILRYKHSAYDPFQMTIKSTGNIVAFDYFSDLEDMWEVKEEWYNNIPSEGVPCWVSDHDNRSKHATSSITTYDRSSPYPFQSAPGYRWKYATPIKPSECWDD